jgi:hypothetical protein
VTLEFAVGAVTVVAAVQVAPVAWTVVVGMGAVGAAVGTVGVARWLAPYALCFLA